MAEIGGTIFGVISLSIQLIENFSKYTNSVKDATTKAEHIRGELDRLVDLLEHLESMIGKFDHTTPAALTKVNIQECARAIDVIRARVAGAHPTASSRGFWTGPRKIIKRLAFPFKEADIKYWKDVLSSIQQNLQTALLALQM
jgi:hypothetical protein